jgi:hypothetical protein
MRRLAILLLVAVPLLAAGGARASPLGFEGTLSALVGSPPPLAISGGGVATLNGSSGPIPGHLATLRLKASRGNLSGTATRIVTDPGLVANGIRAVVLEAAVGTGTLAPISRGPGLTRNRLPVGGVAKLCLLSTACTDFLPLVLTQPTTNGARYQVNTATANQLTPHHLQGKRLGVPGSGVRGVGVGGLVTAGGVAAIRISLQAAPWTVGTAQAIDQTAAGTRAVTLMGFAHGPASATSTTAQPGGIVQLVTPSQVRTNLALGGSRKVAVLGQLLVRFVPEPGLLVLLASAVAGLLLLGRGRIR